jgi:hypothetical protein
VEDLTQTFVRLLIALLYCELAVRLAGIYQSKQGRIHTSEIAGIVVLWLPIAIVAVFRVIFRTITRGR